MTEICSTCLRIVIVASDLGLLSFVPLISDVLSSIQGLGVFQMPPPPVPVVVSVFSVGVLKEDGDRGQWGRHLCRSGGSRLCFQGVELRRGLQMRGIRLPAPPEFSPCLTGLSHGSHVIISQRRSALIGQLSQNPGPETLQTTGLEKRHPSDEMLILHSPSQDAQQCF